MSATQTTSPQRRQLRFQTIDDMLADVERLAEHERAGRLTQCGNWSLGQTLNHLTTWTNFAFEGYPASVCPPLPIRLMIRMMRNRILTKGMSSGIKMRSVPGGTLGIEPIPCDQALPEFRAAMDRLRQTCPADPNPIFGPLTHDQWIQLNLRHAELHLSFQLSTADTTAVV